LVRALQPAQQDLGSTRITDRALTQTAFDLGVTGGLTLSTRCAEPDARREVAALVGALERTPLLAVLGTDGDSLREWLAAGQALGYTLLHARAEGVSASYLSPT
jgi:hypothetical protein